MTELIFQKDLILKRQVYQENVWFAIIGIWKMLDLNSSQIFAINVVLDVSVQNQRRIEILNVNGVDCGCILSGTSRNKSVNILNNSV